MIIFVLVFIIALMSIRQSEERRLTALIYTLLTLIHTIAWGKEPPSGYLYYLTAALNDLLIIFVLANLKYTSKLTENLMKINIGFIVLSSISWIIWMAGIDTYIDCYIAMGLYFLVIVSLLNLDGLEDGNYKMVQWANYFRVDNLASAFSFKKLHKEGRN